VIIRPRERFQRKVSCHGRVLVIAFSLGHHLVDDHAAADADADRDDDNCSQDASGHANCGTNCGTKCGGTIGAYTVAARNPSPWGALASVITGDTGFAQRFVSGAGSSGSSGFTH